MALIFFAIFFGKFYLNLNILEIISKFIDFLKKNSNRTSILHILDIIFVSDTILV